MDDNWEHVCPIHARPREDELWMITCGTLVITMQAAFGLVEAGSVSGKNCLNIMMKNMMDLTVGGLVWYMFGYWIAFRRGSPFSEIEDPSHWFFQWSFAATAATIDSGAVAERIRFLPYVVLSLFTTGVIYPVVVYAAWHPDGWLYQLGFQDFAGGGVVHLLGATSGFVVCKVLGPRIGRYQDYRPRQGKLAEFICCRSQDPVYYMRPAGHPNIQAVTDPISLIFGAFFLWIGWYGFNPGSTGGTADAKTYIVTRVAVNTSLGAIAGAGTTFVSMLVLNNGSMNPAGLSMGVLAGLVSVTSGCAWFSNRSSFIVGILGAISAMSSKSLLQAMRIDDVVNAIPVHGAAGLLGTLAIGFFGEDWSCNGPGGPVGVFFASEDQQGAAWELLWHQAVGCSFIMLFGGIATFVVVLSLNYTPKMYLRLERQIELGGIDEYEHEMGHDDLDFQNILGQLVQRVASSRGCSLSDIIEAFEEANCSLHLDHAKDEYKQKRHELRKGGLLQVRIECLEGLDQIVTQLSRTKSSFELSGGHLARRLAKLRRPGLAVIVEVAAAKPPEEGESVTERLFNYVAPQHTPWAPEGDVVRWDSTLRFEQFYLPAGCEYTTFAIFTVVRSGQILGQSHVAITPQVWWTEASSSGPEAAKCVESLHFFPVGYESQNDVKSLRLKVQVEYTKSPLEDLYDQKRSKDREQATPLPQDADSGRGRCLQCEHLQKRVDELELRLLKLEGPAAESTISTI